MLDVQRRTLTLLRHFRFTHLLLDGTSWKRGQHKYHYMVLSVLVGLVAISIYRKQLDPKGMTLLDDRKYIGQK